MFDENDFKISMEKELRLRMINDEINHCNDVPELRKQLIHVTRLFTQYQHLLEVAVKRLIVNDLKKYMELDKLEASESEIMAAPTPDSGSGGLQNINAELPLTAVQTTDITEEIAIDITLLNDLPDVP